MLQAEAVWGSNKAQFESSVFIRKIELFICFFRDEFCFFYVFQFHLAFDFFFPSLLWLKMNGKIYHDYLNDAGLRHP